MKTEKEIRQEIEDAKSFVDNMQQKILNGDVKRTEGIQKKIRQHIVKGDILQFVLDSTETEIRDELKRVSTEADTLEHVRENEKDLGRDTEEMTENLEVLVTEKYWFEWVLDIR